MASGFAPAPSRTPRFAAVVVSVAAIGLGVGLIRLVAPQSGGSSVQVASGDVSVETVSTARTATGADDPDDANPDSPTTSPPRSLSPQGAQSLSTLMVAGSGRAAVPVGDGRHALTTAGSLRPGDLIEVITADGSVVSAEVVTVITDRDLAVLALSRPMRGVVRTIATEPPTDGDHVAVGLAAVDAYVRMTPSGPTLDGGLSLLEGEPVIDDRGHLLGLVSRASDGSARIVMIPALAALRSSILVIDVWLGLRFETDSLRVLEAQTGSPADVAGITVGDVLRSIGSSELRSIDDLWTALARSKPGDVVRLTVLRDGIEQELAVELASRPS